MVKFRFVKLQDIKQIQQIEKEYYEGFNCPLELLKDWIKNLPKNFIVVEQGNRIIGFLFFEYIREIKAIPFIHKLENNKIKEYIYISEIGILDEFQNSDILQKLIDKVIKKSKIEGYKGIVWLTGSKSKHDKIESRLLLKNKFIKKEKINHWEAYPNHFVNDHFIWIKEA